MDALWIEGEPTELQLPAVSYNENAMNTNWISA